MPYINFLILGGVLGAAVSGLLWSSAMQDQRVALTENIPAIREQVRKDFERQAIKRGYALYCPKSGDFAWKNGCK